MTNPGLELASKIFCAGLLTFQAMVINAFLSKLYCKSWWSWITVDIVVLVVWVLCQNLIRRRFAERIQEYRETGGESPLSSTEQSPHELKCTYIAWLTYVTFLLPRVILLFANLVQTLDERDTLGPNMLKIGIACTPLIFFCLVYGSHNSRPLTPRHAAVKTVAHSGAVDLFDSLDLLEFLFLPYDGVDLPVGYRHAALTFACVSTFLPVLLLYGLNYKTCPGRIPPLSFQVASVLCNLALINIPNLVIRSVLWHNFNIKCSVLIMKNVLGISMSFLEVFEYFGDSRPVICKKCTDWFERSAYRKHKDACGVIDNSIPMSGQLITGSETTLRGNDPGS